MYGRILVFMLAIAAISTITAMTSTKIVYAYGGHHGFGWDISGGKGEKRIE
jgi:hypothetical protein